MAKNIAAGIAGVLIAVGLVWLVEMTGHSVYPPPAGIDFSDDDAVRAYTTGLPLGAFLFIGGAWFIGALGGTVAACRLGTAQPGSFALVIGGTVFAATVANLYFLPHPTWFSIAGLLGIVVAAWLGMRIGVRGREQALRGISR